VSTRHCVRGTKPWLLHVDLRWLGNSLGQQHYSPTWPMGAPELRINCYRSYMTNSDRLQPLIYDMSDRTIRFNRRRLYTKPIFGSSNLIESYGVIAPIFSHWLLRQFAEYSSITPAPGKPSREVVNGDG
jgi:hypothetical protein